MTISNVFKNSGYAAIFGFMGLIAGIWIADRLYGLTTTSISLIIILLIIVASAVLGFIKGKELLED